MDFLTTPTDDALKKRKPNPVLSTATTEADDDVTAKKRKPNPNDPTTIVDFSTEDAKIRYNGTPLVDLLGDKFAKYKLVSPDGDEFELQNDQRIVCVGDVHGDIDAFEKALTIAGVYDKNDTNGNTWIGGNTILLQIGDILDRGTDELKCLELVASLSRQAAQHNGAVIVLHGNHEGCNYMLDFRFVGHTSEEFTGSAKIISDTLGSSDWVKQYDRYGGEASRAARRAMMEPGGVLSKLFWSKLKVGVTIGKTVFIHAGLTVHNINRFGSIQSMNRGAKEWMERTPEGIVFDNFQMAGGEDGKSSDSRSAVQRNVPKYLDWSHDDKTQPVWYKGYGMPFDRPISIGTEKTLTEALTVLGVDRMVVGHCIQRRINGPAQGKLWRIDVGMSRAFEPTADPEVLEICKNSDGEEVVRVLTKDGPVEGTKRYV